MGWKPPDQSDIEALKWLGVAGAMAALVDLMKALSDRDERSIWELLAHSLLMGFLSIGIGALQISVLRLPILAVIGLSTSMAFLGAEAFMEAYRWLTRRGN